MGLLGPWVPSVVQRLSAFHEELTAKFNAITEESTLGIVNYYQEPESDKYEIVSIDVKTTNKLKSFFCFLT